MRDPARIDEFLQVFRNLWERYPDMRFGQLVVNTLGSDPFYKEDDEALLLVKYAEENW